MDNIKNSIINNVLYDDKLIKDYRIVEIDIMDKRLLVNSEIFFEKNRIIRENVSNMLDYYLNHSNNVGYEMTDYFCDKKAKLCICNIYAENFRKIYMSDDYNKGKKYISWFNK